MNKMSDEHEENTDAGRAEGRRLLKRKYPFTRSQSADSFLSKRRALDLREPNSKESAEEEDSEEPYGGNYELQDPGELRAEDEIRSDEATDEEGPYEDQEESDEEEPETQGEYLPSDALASVEGDEDQGGEPASPIGNYEDEEDQEEEGEWEEVEEAEEEEWGEEDDKEGAEENEKEALHLSPLYFATANGDREADHEDEFLTDSTENQGFSYNNDAGETSSEGEAEDEEEATLHSATANNDYQSDSSES